MDYKKHLGDSIDVYHLQLAAIEDANMSEDPGKQVLYSKGPCVFAAFSCPRIVSSDSSFSMGDHSMQ